MRGQAVVALFAVAMTAGCATVKAVPAAAGHAIVDCAKAEALPILELVATLGAEALGSALGTGKIDWDGLKGVAKAKGISVGGCAFAAFVAALSKPKTTPEADPGAVLRVGGPTLAADAQAALEQLRGDWGGVEWKQAP